MKTHSLIHPHPFVPNPTDAGYGAGHSHQRIRLSFRNDIMLQPQCTEFYAVSNCDDGDARNRVLPRGPLQRAGRPARCAAEPAQSARHSDHRHRGDARRPRRLGGHRTFRSREGGMVSEIPGTVRGHPVARYLRAGLLAAGARSVRGVFPRLRGLDPHGDPR